MLSLAKGKFTGVVKIKTVKGVEQNILTLNVPLGFTAEKLPQGIFLGINN